MQSRDEMLQRMRAGAFRRNNGKVLRVINTLRHEFTPLADIVYALPKLKLPDIKDSINYLHEAGYIHLRTIEGQHNTQLADAPYDELEAKLSAQGIRLLNGAIQDEVVEV